MLPFVLKIADQPIERLQRIDAESQSIDVNVQVELYAREINRARRSAYTSVTKIKPGDLARSHRKRLHNFYHVSPK